MNWVAIFRWAAVVLAVLLILGWTLKRSQAPGRLAGKWLITAIAIAGIWLLFSRAFRPASGFLGGIGSAFVLGLGTAVFALVMAIVWTRSLISSLTSPLLRLFYDEHQEIEPAPLYSQALALRKRGHYLAAVAEVEHQLEQFPNDLTGTLLLAEIHAVDLHHLENAERILEHFMRNTSVGNSVVALNQMADWRLGLGQDLHGAREALERIRKLCPDTEAAYMASQRLAHLDDPERFQELHTLQPNGCVRFPRPDGIGAPLDVHAEAIEPVPEASQLVRHLEQYPEDFEARERLATVYAERFQRMDLARGELEQLIATKKAPRKKVVAWLNRLADLEIQVDGNMAAARAALQRIVDANPNAGAAEMARRRMNFLERELRARSGPH